MQLIMYLDNTPVASIVVEHNHISKPGYLGKFKRFLKIKHHNLVVQSGSVAEFVLADVQPVEEPLLYAY
jgi:hypothetical protein